MPFVEFKEKIEEQPSPALAAIKLLRYCSSNNWSGYDPYDGLNSKIFQRLNFLHFSIFRLILIQMMKRSPVNFRRLLSVPKTQNPKGIAVFLTAVIKYNKLGLINDHEMIRTLAETLISLSSLNDDKYTCWGYNFDWQALTGFEKYGTPNIICTTFAGNALLDIYELSQDCRFLETAIRAVNFINDHLYIDINKSDAFYNYTPGNNKLVFPCHNANLLGAAYIARVAHLTGHADILEKVIKTSRFSVKWQHVDGSWDYGECDRPSQRWIDNFHTGYNLCALRNIGRDAETSEFENSIRRGLDFYLSHFFNKHGAPKYYHDSLYPIDIHSAAQSIITLVTFKDMDNSNILLAKKVFNWTIKNMWNSEGYFYFQKHRWWTNKIPYMRWSQAWMLLALITLEEQLKSHR